MASGDGLGAGGPRPSLPWPIFKGLVVFGCNRLLTREIAGADPERLGVGGNMKKTGLLLLLMVTATVAVAQQSTTAVTPDASGVVNTSVNVPFVRFQTPTAADIYCAGFLTKDPVPHPNYVNGGLQTPSSTKLAVGELVYLAGSGYQAGQLYSIIREMRDGTED